MLLLIFIIALAFTLFVILKDLLAPPIVLCLTWSFPLVIGLLHYGVCTDLFNDPLYFFYLLGLLIFTVGYFVSQRKIPVNPQRLQVDVSGLFLSNKIIVSILILEFIITSYTLWRIRAYISVNFLYNFWFSYKMGISREEINLGFLVTFNQVFVRLFALYLFILALNIKNKVLHILALIQIILAVLLLTFSSRSTMFSVLIPMLFIYMLVKRRNFFQLLKYGVFSLILLLVVFLIIHILKYAYVETESFSGAIAGYAVFPLVAFKNILSAGYIDYQYGKYFIRFFIAVFEKLGFSVTPVSTLEPFVFNELGSGNVFTFYKWYTNDFGIYFALFIQGLCGMLHGALYSNMYLRKTPGLLFWNALLYYPLMMQFFSDQYMTILSVWIQAFIFYFIFYRLLVKRKPDKEHV